MRHTRDKTSAMTSRGPFPSKRWLFALEAGSTTFYCSLFRQARSGFRARRCKCTVQARKSRCSDLRRSQEAWGLCAGLEELSRLPMAGKTGFTPRKHLTSGQRCKQCALLRVAIQLVAVQSNMPSRNRQRRWFARTDATRSGLAAADPRFGVTAICR